MWISLRAWIEFVGELSYILLTPALNSLYNARWKWQEMLNPDEYDLKCVTWPYFHKWWMFLNPTTWIPLLDVAPIVLKFCSDVSIAVMTDMQLNFERWYCGNLNDRSGCLSGMGEREIDVWNLSRRHRQQNALWQVDLDIRTWFN
jgi:hypothetical protein